MARPRTTDAQRAMLVQFGAHVREAREDAGLSQAQLGHAVGADQQYIRTVEQGSVNVGVTRIVELARTLDVPPSSLLQTFDA